MPRRGHLATRMMMTLIIVITIIRGPPTSPRTADRPVSAGAHAGNVARGSPNCRAGTAGERRLIARRLIVVTNRHQPREQLGPLPAMIPGGGTAGGGGAPPDSEEVATTAHHGNGRAAGAAWVTGHSVDIPPPAHVIGMINRHHRARGSQPRIREGGPGNGLVIKTIGAAVLIGLASRERCTSRHDGTEGPQVMIHHRRHGTRNGSGLHDVSSSTMPRRLAITSGICGLRHASPSHADTLYAKGRMT